MKKTTVLIAGAGVAGPTLAYWLERGGFEPTLVERAAEARGGGAVLDFWGLGWRVAERMGLLPRLQEVGYHIRAIRNVNASGRTVARLDAEALGRALENRFISLARGDLAMTVLDSVRGRVETVWGDSIAAHRDDGRGVDVQFKSGVQRRFDLVVGADGLHSGLRRQLFGEEGQYRRDLGYHFASFSAADYPHRDADEYVSFGAVGRQITRYTLRGGRTGFLLVWLGTDPDGWRAFADDGWECEAVLEAQARGDEYFDDSVSQIRLPSWSRGRVALVGDAAYCPSLLAGEGSGMGMAGAYLLAAALVRHGGEHVAAFREYEGAFHAVAGKKQDAARRYAGWFAPKSRLGLRMRDLVTNALGMPGLSGLLLRAMLREGVTLPAFPDPLSPA